MIDSKSDSPTLREVSSIEKKLLLIGLGSICVLVVVFMSWSLLAPLSSAVIARGVIKAEGNRKTLQHLEGGIVRQILVKDGDLVKANQVVMVLDDERVNAGLDQLSAQLDNERTRESRLRAESEFTTNIQWPQDLLKRQEPQARARASELISKEKEIFLNKRESLSKQLSLLKLQSSQIDNEIKSLAAQISSAQQAQTFIQQELKVTKELADQGFLQRTRVMNLERDASAQAAAIEAARAEQAKATQRKTDVELKQVAARQDYERSAAESLKETVARRVDLEERLRPISDSSARQKILAPISGTIVDLRYFVKGAVVGPREPIMDIVPDQANLIVEAKIRAEDAPSIMVGQKSSVRLLSAKQRETHNVDAKIVYVAADQSVERQTGQAFFVVNLEIDPKSLAQEGNPKLASGVPVEVFIEIAPRTLLQYLLEPLFAGFRRGMREH